MWHCPHCGAPQAETARCWVCRRSSTTCSTCRHFRTSLTVDVGYCGLDRGRRPLTGRELRGCWTERPALAEEDGARQATERHVPASRLPDLPIRGFVPLDDVEAAAPESVPPPIVLLGDPVESWDARTSLFGELER